MMKHVYIFQGEHSKIYAKQSKLVLLPHIINMLEIININPVFTNIDHFTLVLCSSYLIPVGGVIKGSHLPVKIWKTWSQA